MKNEISDEAQAEWDNTYQLWEEFLEANALINQALSTGKDPGSLHFAFNMIKTLPIPIKKTYLKQLLSFCSSGKYAGKVQEIILILPTEWLIENIEREAESTLIHDDFLDWVNILSVFTQIDLNLGKRFAARMTSHTDPEIGAWGKEFLDDHT